MRDVARFFKILADDARLQILWLLSNQRELCVCDLMAVLGTTQSKVSRHLALLRLAGLVQDRRQGAWSYDSLRVVDNALARGQLDALKKGLARHPDAAGLLGELWAWQQRKERGAACTPARPRSGATAKAARARTHDDQGETV